MHITKRKEEFSLAYARAVAAVAGFATSVPNPDNDSIDLSLHKKSPDAEDDDLISAPQLNIQVKCTEREIIKNDALHLVLKIKNYNDLRKTRVMVPRILLVHCLPKAISEWLRHSEEDMLLRHCSYWVSLKGAPGAGEGQKTVTVQIPQENQFTPDAVLAIMERIEKGEPL